MLDELLALPQEDDVWIAGAHQLPKPVKGGGSEPPWLLLIQSRTRHFVLGFQVLPEEPDAQTLLNTLVNAMFEPAQGEPSRPTAVEQGPNLEWEPVGPMLEQIEIDLRPAGPLQNLNTAFQYLSIQVCGAKIPGLAIEPE
jgi:hypothetical protein